MSNAGSSEELLAAVGRLQAEVAELRSSRRRLAEAAHADRRAIERDLHDGVQQHLVALAVDLRRLAELVDRDSTAAQALLAEVTANVLEAVDEAAKLATRVYPPLLDGAGFASAVRSAAAGIGRGVVLDVPSLVGYPPEITAVLYWTCVEALSSASGGSEASVSVRTADGGLTFEVTTIGRHPGESLERLSDRIEAINGRISIDDRADGSTRIQGWMPLPG